MFSPPRCLGRWCEYIQCAHCRCTVYCSFEIKNINHLFCHWMWRGLQSPGLSPADRANHRNPGIQFNVQLPNAPIFMHVHGHRMDDIMVTLQGHLRKEIWDPYDIIAKKNVRTSRCRVRFRLCWEDLRHFPSKKKHSIRYLNLIQARIEKNKEHPTSIPLLKHFCLF